MIGGEKEAVDEVLPVLNTMARWTFNMGGPGSGHVCKTFNNYMTGAAIAALNDCLVVGHKMGLDPVGAPRTSSHVPTAQLIVLRPSSRTS